jgi:hypothetical protein
MGQVQIIEYGILHIARNQIRRNNPSHCHRNLEFAISVSTREMSSVLLAKKTMAILICAMKHQPRS